MKCAIETCITILEEHNENDYCWAHGVKGFEIDEKMKKDGRFRESRKLRRVYNGIARKQKEMV